MDFTNSPPEWQNNGEEPSQSLKESGFTPGYKPPASFFNWFWSKVGKCLSEIQNKMLGQKRVTELPSTTREYTFDNTTDFTAVERCTLSTVTEGSDKFLRVTTASNSGNKYALANLNFTDIGQTANTFVIEMDTRMPSSRWYISLVDLSKRPGESNKVTYDTSGVAFFSGTSDGVNYNVNGADLFSDGFDNVWLHTKITVDMTAKTAMYEIRNRTEKTLLASGTTNFKDSGVDKITGIELYSYTQTTIDIDNLKIVAGYNIEENVLYCVGSNEVCDTYAYFDGEPVCISSQTDVQSLSESEHTHSNKDILDDISSSDVSHWTTAYSQRHTHSNKTVLDGITSAKVSEWDSKAPLANPIFTGSPKAPTPSSTDNSTRIATTAFVQDSITKALSGIANARLGDEIKSLTVIIYKIQRNGHSEYPYYQYRWTSCMTTHDGNISNTDSSFTTWGNGWGMTNGIIGYNPNQLITTPLNATTISNCLYSGPLISTYVYKILDDISWVDASSEVEEGSYALYQKATVTIQGS